MALYGELMRGLRRNEWESGTIADVTALGRHYEKSISLDGNKQIVNEGMQYGYMICLKEKKVNPSGLPKKEKWKIDHTHKGVL